MHMRTIVIFFAVAVGAMAGCYLTPGNGNGAGGGGGGGGGGTTTAGDGGTVAMTGVPCNVAQALTACMGCHGPSPSAPISLASYADLTAQSTQYPGQTEAQRAVSRMSGNPSLMPPGGPAPAQADIDTINAWISGGYPQGSCGSSGEGGANPYNTAVVCTSGLTNTSTESQSMKPGEACISCHANSTSESGPIDAIMGTIYPTAHEPNDCVGASASTFTGVQITATDGQGHSVTVSPNSTGNFLGGMAGVFTSAYTVKITYQGRERDMTTPQTSGDCNSCHTETGANGAPGRVMLP